MNRIPIAKSNQYLLCDDEDYDLLIPYRWHVYASPSRKGLLAIRAYVKELRANVSPLRLLFGQGSYAFGSIFRDKNIYNYQRHNILRAEDFERRKLISFYIAKHCPHGLCTLTNKRSEGRSALCFECMMNSFEYYSICLDVIAHRTHWKGWRRRGIET